MKRGEMAHPPLEIFTQRVRGSISAGLNVSPPMGSSEMAGQSGLCSLVSLEGCEDDDISVWKFARQAPTAALGHDSLADQSRGVYSAVEARRLAQPAGSARWLSPLAQLGHMLRAPSRQALTHTGAAVSKPPQPQSQMAAESATEPTMAVNQCPSRLERTAAAAAAFVPQPAGEGKGAASRLGTARRRRQRRHGFRGKLTFPQLLAHRSVIIQVLRLMQSRIDLILRSKGGRVDPDLRPAGVGQSRGWLCAPRRRCHPSGRRPRYPPRCGSPPGPPTSRCCRPCRAPRI